MFQWVLVGRGRGGHGGTGGPVHMERGPEGRGGGGQLGGAYKREIAEGVGEGGSQREGGVASAAELVLGGVGRGLREDRGTPAGGHWGPGGVWVWRVLLTPVETNNTTQPN